MALFSRTPKKDLPAQAGTTKVATTPVAASAKGGPSSGGKVSGIAKSLAHILRSPRITEKASMHMERSAYVFDVTKEANKKQIAAAVFAIYKVKPRKVAIVNIKPKNVRNMRTGKSGVKGGGKKAYVYLNIGETITVT